MNVEIVGLLHFSVFCGEGFQITGDGLANFREIISYDLVLQRNNHNGLRIVILIVIYWVDKYDGNREIIVQHSDQLDNFRLNSVSNIDVVKANYCINGLANRRLHFLGGISVIIVFFVYNLATGQRDAYNQSPNACLIHKRDVQFRVDLLFVAVNCNYLAYVGVNESSTFLVSYASHYGKSNASNRATFDLDYHEVAGNDDRLQVYYYYANASNGATKDFD